MKILFRLFLVFMLTITAFWSGYKYSESKKESAAYDVALENHRITRESEAHIAISEMKIIQNIREPSESNNLPQLNRSICGYLKTKLKIVSRNREVIFSDQAREIIKKSENLVERAGC